MLSFRTLVYSFTALAVLLLVGVSGEAGQKKKGKKGPDAKFAKLDTDNDNKLSRAEFTQSVKKAKRAGKLFTKLDTDNNDSLSREEYRKITDQKKKKKKNAPLESDEPSRSRRPLAVLRPLEPLTLLFQRSDETSVL